MIDEPRWSMIGELGDEEYLLSAKTVVRVLWEWWWVVVLATAQAIRSVEAVEAKILGTVMNNVPNSDSDAYRRYGHEYTY